MSLPSYVSVGNKAFFVQKIPKGAVPDYGFDCPKGMLHVWVKENVKDGKADRQTRTMVEKPF